MDDLVGLRSAKSPGSKTPQSTTSTTTALPTLRPTPPVSGRSSPYSSQSTMRPTPSSKPSTPANDSFAKLLNFNSAHSEKNLSLAERQKQLQQQKLREDQEKQKRLQAQYGTKDDDQIWSALENSGAKARFGDLPSRTSTSQLRTSQPSNGTNEDDDDFLAAFNASAPVNRSTNFPVPSASPSLLNRPADQALATGTTTTTVIDDDDPFELSQFHAKRQQVAESSTNQVDDDDFLGDLAKPVSAFPHPTPKAAVIEPTADFPPSPPNNTPIDKAIAEIMDMGFSIDKAREALHAIKPEIDVQAAVSWLLTQAHTESREKTQSRNREGHEDRPWDINSKARASSQPSRHATQFSSSRTQSPNKNTSRDRDHAQIAAEFGATFLKSANSLWKTGSKKVQQAVQEFNGPTDPSQPRWMKEAMPERFPDRPEEMRAQRGSAKGKEPAGIGRMTDEAMMLESRQPPLSRQSRSTDPPQRAPIHDSHDGASDLQNVPRSRFEKENLRSEVRSEPHSNMRNEPRPRLSRFGTEEQATKAYISPARRRKAPSNVTPPAMEPDLLKQPAISTKQPRPATTSPIQKPRTNAPTPPKLTPRAIPHIPPQTLSSIHNYRQKGSEAYKRGDYAIAHESYTTAISLAPIQHPIVIVLLSNRALTALKIGEPKTAISDSDKALAIIGPSKGHSETIELTHQEPPKDMREFFGKALMRKAEALEQLEKWGEASNIWREAVESGHGGSTSMQGRNRCEKAEDLRRNGPASAQARPSSAPARQKPAPRISVKPSSVSTKPAEAVTRLRAANEEADRVDNERFALADAVDAKLSAWRGGKQDNLRALLASLDAVLWPEAGWKKISMAELIIPNKVKIQYMKGIAKVHPDKIPVNATTEQKMISAAVFSTLNEAWDKFKRENGL
ncbi:hypothetical protein FQN57_007247 [Myotisia sp. PD_48]|nr:hypothetical protein FQN57_007247 [Myotisia sp. PD_48]